MLNVIVYEDNEKLYEISLIENLQREDLSPVEEALGYKKLMEDYNLTQEDVLRLMLSYLFLDLLEYYSNIHIAHRMHMVNTLQSFYQSQLQDSLN